MNSEARDKAARYAEGLQPRQVVAYNPKNGRVSVFKFGANRKEEALQAVGWTVVHRYTPGAIKAVVQQAATVNAPPEQSEPPAKRGRPFSKTDKP